MPLTIDKNGNASATCDCGKPITVTNKYGMFCEDMCGLKESKEAGEFLDIFIDNLLKEEG